MPVSHQHNSKLNNTKNAIAPNQARWISVMVRITGQFSENGLSNLPSAWALLAREILLPDQIISRTYFSCYAHQTWQSSRARGSPWACRISKAPIERPSRAVRLSNILVSWFIYPELHSTTYDHCNFSASLWNFDARFAANRSYGSWLRGKVRYERFYQNALAVNCTSRIKTVVLGCIWVEGSTLNRRLSRTHFLC